MDMSQVYKWYAESRSPAATPPTIAPDALLTKSQEISDGHISVAISKVNNLANGSMGSSQEIVF